MPEETKIRVLVVDDDADVREFLGTVLSKEGMRVSFAHDGQQALAHLEQKPVEVLFTDLCMPNKDGFTLLRDALRIHPELSVVVFTGYAKLDSCTEALRLGACDYVTKPFTPQAIQAALARALSSYARKSRAVTLHPQPPEVLDLAYCTDVPDDPIVARSSAIVGNLQEIDRMLIKAAIAQCRGNKAAAARALGLHRRTLYRILRGETGHEQPGEARADRR